MRTILIAFWRFYRYLPVLGILGLSSGCRLAGRPSEARAAVDSYYAKHASASKMQGWDGSKYLFSLQSMHPHTRKTSAIVLFSPHTQNPWPIPNMEHDTDNCTYLWAASASLCQCSICTGVRTPAINACHTVPKRSCNAGGRPPCLCLQRPAALSQQETGCNTDTEQNSGNEGRMTQVIY